MGYLGSRPASYYDDDYDPDLEDARAEARWQRQYQARLSRNPDCRDPDHPGCEHCNESETDDETEGESDED